MPLTFDLAVPPYLDVAAADALAQTLAGLDPSRAHVIIARQRTPAPATRAGDRLLDPPGAVLEAYARAIAALRRCPLPTLAIAEGRTSEATGGIFSACDVVLATRDASFDAPRGTGPVPAWGVFMAFRRRVQPSLLKAWTWTEHPVSVGEAIAAHLVDERIIGLAVTARTAAWARALATASAGSRAYLRHRFDQHPQPASASDRIA